MNKLICPLSEEFLYCSPELPEKGCYRVLMETQQPMLAAQKTDVVDGNGYALQKSEAYKKSGKNSW